MNSRPIPVAENFKFHLEWPLCVIDVFADVLANRFDIPLQQWNEPGLSTLSGFCCQLPSGTVIFIEESVHLREHIASGTTIYIEARELIGQDCSTLLAATLSAIGLSFDNVVWSQTDEGIEGAKLAMKHNGLAP
jgi:hypothetical protein